MQIRLPVQSICLDLVSAGGFIISCASPHPSKFLYVCPDLRTLACKTLFPQGDVLLGTGTRGSLGLGKPVSLGKAVEKQQFAPSVVLYQGREGYLGAAIRAI